MDYNLVETYAVANSSEEYGSDVMLKINEKFASAARGKLKFVIGIIQYLTNFFEIQRSAFEKNEENWLEEFNTFVREALEGDGKDLKGAKWQLEYYFHIAEFTRDADMKRAIALYLKYYLEYIRDNVEYVTANEFLNLPLYRNFDGNYFNKNYVFGELINIIDAELT